MINKMIANQLVSESQLNTFIERDCKLLTSKDLAKVHYENKDRITDLYFHLVD